MLEDKTETKLEQKVITFPNATGAGNQTAPSVTFEKPFTLIKSVALIAITAGGLPSYDVTIRDSSSGKDVIQQVDSNYLKAGADKASQPLNYRNYGQSFDIITALPIATTSELKYKLIFELEKVDFEK